MSALHLLAPKVAIEKNRKKCFDKLFAHVEFPSPLSKNNKSVRVDFYSKLV